MPQPEAPGVQRAVPGVLSGATHCDEGPLVLKCRQEAPARFRVVVMLSQVQAPGLDRLRTKEPTARPPPPGRGSLRAAGLEAEGLRRPARRLVLLRHRRRELHPELEYRAVCLDLLQGPAPGTQGLREWNACLRGEQSWIRDAIFPDDSSSVGALTDSLDYHSLACNGAKFFNADPDVIGGNFGSSYDFEPYASNVGGWGTLGQYNEIAQLSAGYLDAETTLTIGDNDADFSGTGWTASTPQWSARRAMRWPCRTSWE
ncbi:MAG TPA: hypothetical protein VIM73_10835 [Polyangiaceae bacterium]